MATMTNLKKHALDVRWQSEPCVGTVILSACIATTFAPLAIIMTACFLWTVWGWGRVRGVPASVRAVVVRAHSPAPPHPLGGLTFG